jgi:hypothetical protein
MFDLGTVCLGPVTRIFRTDQGHAFEVGPTQATPGRLSALPLIAFEFRQRRELTYSANRVLTHCSKQPHYSITSSARTSSAAGISSPSVEVNHELELGRVADRAI